jgi:transposase
MFIDNAFDRHTDEVLFKHDNAPAYRSGFTNKWFKDNKINLLRWPPSSPHLNPIENLCDHIDKQLRKMKPRNVDELREIIETLWFGVATMCCKKLVDSMPSRIQRCLLARSKSFSKS